MNAPRSLFEKGRNWDVCGLAERGGESRGIGNSEG